MAKQCRESLLAKLLHTGFMFFVFDEGTKKLFVSFNYHVLLGKYCKKHLVFMIVFRNPDKILPTVNHCLLKYCTLHNTHFALEY